MRCIGNSSGTCARVTDAKVKSQGASGEPMCKRARHRRLSGIWEYDSWEASADGFSLCQRLVGAATTAGRMRSHYSGDQ
jgi:hypothetical protein